MKRTFRLILKRGSELLMIIVGVFIALVANAWWESRTDARLAADYRNRLLAELTYNKFLIDTVAIHTGRVQIASDSLLPFFEIGTVTGSPSRVIVNSYHATRRWTETFSRATYDDLMNTGNIRLLPSSELRSALTAFYQMAARLPSDWYGAEFRQSVRQIIPADIQLNIRECPAIAGPNWNACPLTIDPARARNVVRVLRADAKVVGAFRVQIHELSIFGRDLDRLNARLNDALALLQYDSRTGGVRKTVP